MPLTAALVLGGASLIGGAMAGNAAESAAQTGASAQLESARIGAQAGAFRPVNISTRFGQSNFVTEIDPTTGLPVLKEAGYVVDPGVQRLREGLFNLLPTGVATAEQMGMRYMPSELAAQRIMGLGTGLLPEEISRQASPEAMTQAASLYDISQQLRPTTFDPQAAARDYFQRQVGLLEPQRAREQQALERSTFARGRTGLSVGDIGSPELYSLARAREQQNAELAFQSQERARQEMLQNLGLSTDYGLRGLQIQQAGEDVARQRFAQDIAQSQGLFAGADQLYGLTPSAQVRALSPFQTQLGLVTSLEELAQRPLAIGSELGNRQSTAGAQGGSLLAQAGQNAANLRTQASMVGPSMMMGTLNNVLGNPYLMKGMFGQPSMPNQVSTVGPRNLAYLIYCIPNAGF
jgi:hypothetical protein